MLLTGSPGQNLLPVLKARIQAVDDAVDGMSGDTLTSGRAVRVTHAEGWYSGDSQRVWQAHARGGTGACPLCNMAPLLPLLVAPSR
jgi:hypothetical protein